MGVGGVWGVVGSTLSFFESDREKFDFDLINKNTLAKNLIGLDRAIKKEKVERKNKKCYHEKVKKET